MSNFDFLSPKLKPVYEEAINAESNVNGDSRVALFYTRRALEQAVHWLYRHDSSIRKPYDTNLAALLHEPTFQNQVPEAVFQKARLIQKTGNEAVHSDREVGVELALQLVKELHHICFWIMRTYLPLIPRDGAGWRDSRVSLVARDKAPVTRKDLEALEEKLSEQSKAALKQQLEFDALDAERQALIKQLAEAKATSVQELDTHDYSEADTRHLLIDEDLRRAGWPLTDKRDREFEVTGMPNQQGIGYVDYVLWGDDGKPLAVVEAKRSTSDPGAGQQQAKLYADCLEQMFEQRPLIFYTNGYQTWLWDDTGYPARRVAGFHSKESLQRLVLRRTQKTALDVSSINNDIAGRYYQKRVIGSLFDTFAKQKRKTLLVMATGTGKTRTAIALVDVMRRAGWIKRALFLADRISLVNQACNAFKLQLPDASPVNLVTEKDTDGRVYVCTYGTMMGLIDQTKNKEARFDVGHFDLVIVDEAYRSVYNRYGAIFTYFDSLLVGLTATPVEEIDRNTYDLFEQEAGVPTDAYELDTAVKDGFLVPPNVQQVDMRFPRDGIDYESLSEEEKAQWEETDWGDEADSLPTTRVDPPAINNWLFNTNTVDLVLQHLMQHGHHVEGGDRLAKTIIFARNHKHAKFIEERFNHHYPHLEAGHFARVIDNQAKYAQSLIETFSSKDKTPHIAISVDMLDTGIDVPEVLNLVFFKPVYSKIKFWQMIGRGTRPCPEVFGPGVDKQDFRVFDFCFNFDFFREKPQGRSTGDSPSLAARLFRARLELVGHLQANREHDPDTLLRETLSDTLHSEVEAMSRDNFIVRLQLEAVERFQDRNNWQTLSDTDRATLSNNVAGLPSALETDDIESRLFDLTALRMQLALLDRNTTSFETARRRVTEIAQLLEDKNGVPAVAEQLSYLARIQETEFWEGIDLIELEDMRERLRGLVPFLDKSQRTIVYTQFQDEILDVRSEVVIDMPKMTGVQYEKKVRDYLNSHRDHLVIHRLRTNQPLTATDLDGLEKTLTEIGADEGQMLLSSLVENSDAPSLAWFVKSMVGMERTAAQSAFAEFLNDRSLNAQQIRFVEMVIDQLTARGVMKDSALYETPFSQLHAGGPDELFAGKEAVVDNLFATLNAVHTGLSSVVNR